MKGIDIRKHGSGNVGATNALRVLGTGPGITCLAIDVLKGLLPVILLGPLIIARTGMRQDAVLITLGLSCICGHIWTVFLDFKGGKGIATSFGVLIALAILVKGLGIILLLVVLCWLAVFLATHIVSIASVSGAAMLPLLMVFFAQSKVLIGASLVLSLFTIYKHKENIKRFAQGKEKKIEFKKK
jgi:glycerol-3-phosphate acyltransferase PlsY